LPPSRFYRHLPLTAQRLSRDCQVVNVEMLNTNTLDANTLNRRHDLNVADLYHESTPTDRMLDFDNLTPCSATSNKPTAPPTLDHTTGLEPPTTSPCTIPFRIETKRIYTCTHQSCNKTYGRLPELRRHQRGAHLNDQRWKCRSAGCDRMKKGFARRDKRDDHERKVHRQHGSGVTGGCA
jgi:hypothetical protein